MQFEEFLQNNNIILSESLISLCKEGLRQMKKSIDPLHQEDHIFRIFDSLNSLLKYSPTIKKTVNFEILIPAICWHDTWRSQRFYTSKPAFLYTTFFDGLGSARLFRRKAEKLLINKKLIRQITYAIRKHSAVQLLPSNTMAAKILWDLDLLDEWSKQRLNSIEDTYLKPQLLSPRVIKIAKFYFDHYMIRAHESAFYLPWVQNEFELRKEDYISQVQKLTEEYTKD